MASIFQVAKLKEPYSDAIDSQWPTETKSALRVLQDTSKEKAVILIEDITR